MPTYDYRCERCHQQFEYWQSFSEDSLRTCPIEGGPAACEAPGAGPVKKVFSKVGIAFKGEGFYKNDHGANAAARAKESTAGGGTKTDSTSESKKNGSDAKPKEPASAKGSSKTATSSSTSSSSSD